MDAFSEILTGVKLNGALFFSAELSAPWGISTPASDKTAALVAPGASHLLLYHYVIDGHALVEVAGEPPVSLEPGDVVIFPHGAAHLMTSKGAKAPFPNYGISAKIKDRDLS